MRPPVHKAVRIKLPPCSGCGYESRDGHAKGCPVEIEIMQQINEQIKWDIEHPRYI